MHVFARRLFKKGVKPVLILKMPPKEKNWCIDINNNTIIEGVTVRVIVIAPSVNLIGCFPETRDSAAF